MTGCYTIWPVMLLLRLSAAEKILPNITVLTDTTTYYQKFHCVVSNEDLKSAITWITPDLTINPVSEYKGSSTKFRCDMNEDEKCLSSWAAGGWERKNSLDYKFGPIFDYRWEKLEVIQTSDQYKIVTSSLNYKDFEIPFSVRIGKDVSVFLCNKGYPPEGDCYWFLVSGWNAKSNAVRKCYSGEIPRSGYPKPPCSDRLVEKNDTESRVNENEWSHFVLKGFQNTYMLTKMGESEPFLTYTDSSLGFFQPNYLLIRSLMDSIGAWKIHSYSFILTRNSAVMQLGPDFSTDNGAICLALFVHMCGDCKLNLKLTDKDENTIQIMEVEHEGVGWKEIKLIANDTMKKKVKLFVGGTSYNDANKFWAIDDVRKCAQKEVRVSSVISNSYYIPDFSCYSLTFSKLKIKTLKLHDIENSASKCPTNSFGRHCIPCAEVMGQTFCLNQGVCEIDANETTKCTCSAGFKNHKCVNACSKGSYGFGCKEKCGKCQEETCDFINGNCQSCLSGYGGNACKIPYLPVLKYPPLINVSHTFATIQLRNDEYEGSLPPFDYFFQYKQNSQEWQKTQAYSISDLNPKVIANLLPDTKYTIRVILRAENGYYHEEFSKQEEITTTCAGITIADIRIETTNISATVTIQNSTDTCRSTDFYLLFEDRQIACTSYVFRIPSLMPYRKYVITISQMRTEERVETSFTTQQGRPEQIRNLSFSSVTATTVTLTWEPPDIINGILTSYKVFYKHHKYSGCYKPENNDNAAGEITTVATTLSLDNLIPYSEYAIQVLAVTVMEGDVKEMNVETSYTDIPSAEELPTMQYTQAIKLVRIAITQAACAVRKGPITYAAKLCCSNEWCTCAFKNSSASTLEIIYIDMEVYPYSNYVLTVEVQRTGGSFFVEKLENEFTSLSAVPNKVENLTLYSKTAQSALLRWKPPYPPTGELVDYQLRLECTECYRTSLGKQTLKPVACRIWPEFYCGVAKISKGYRNYPFRFYVSARNKVPDEYGEDSYTNTYLIEERPESPKNLTASWDMYYNLTLIWIHPDITNGPLTMFTINISPKLKRNVKISEERLRYTYTYSVEDKLLGSKLSVMVMSVNSAGESDPIKIETYSPPKTPKFSSDPYLKRATNYTLSVVIPAPSDLADDSVLYVIVSDPSMANSPTKQMPKIIEDMANIDGSHFSWIAGEFFLEPYKGTQRILLIGMDENKYSKKLEFEIFNRVLNTGTNYTVTFLLTNTYMNKTRSTVRKLNCSTAGAFGSKDEGSHLYLLGLLLIIPLVCVMGFVLVRKYKIKINVPMRPIMDTVRNVGRRSNPDVIPLAAAESSSIRVKPPVRPKPKTPATVSSKTLYIGTKFSKMVKLTDFEAYVKESIETGELEKQHAIFPRGQTHPWEHGTKPFNKSKNRYNNLAAYDHTRVKLETIDGDPTSDYINANYIEGYNVSKAYIATQGPKVSTLDDFWRMIWQEHVEYIIMLANILENGKKKVEKYWPDINQILIFDSIEVNYVSVDVFADYEYRKFHVTCRGEERTVKQLRFMSWPDHGVPLYAQSLVPFLRRMLTIPHGKSPVVVHCSAGVGRTGTIILCDICLRMAAREGEVDVLYHQYKLREQRANMVDNIEQYKLVHLVLLQCLVAPETNLPCTEETGGLVEKILSGDAINFQMKYLEDTVWQDQAMRVKISNELSPVYPKKNRFKDIIPDEISRVFILPYPTSDATSSYINAVKVDGFQAPSKYIVTQQPLPNTLGDFWRLVNERDISVIVSLNTINALDETSCTFWPTQNVQDMQPVPYLGVTYLEVLNDTGYDIISCQLVNVDDEKCVKRVIRIINVKNWHYDKFHPEEPRELLMAVEEVNRLGKASKCILITCHDGARASGLFVALSFVIDKIKLEQDCDVCLAVRSVRHSRQEFVRNRDQFVFLYKAAVEYINGFEIYSNFASGKK